MVGNIARLTASVQPPPGGWVEPTSLVRVDGRDQLTTNKPPSTPDDDHHRSIMRTGSDLHVRRWPTAADHVKINSQGYWFESNRGSNTAGQRPDRCSARDGAINLRPTNERASAAPWGRPSVATIGPSRTNEASDCDVDRRGPARPGGHSVAERRAGEGAQRRRGRPRGRTWAPPSRRRGLRRRGRPLGGPRPVGPARVRAAVGPHPRATRRQRHEHTGKVTRLVFDHVAALPAGRSFRTYGDSERPKPRPIAGGAGRARWRHPGPPRVRVARGRGSRALAGRGRGDRRSSTRSRVPRGRPRRRRSRTVVPT